MQWPSLPHWLTDRKHGGGGDMGRKHAFHLRENESNWWTGQLWKIGSPIWGLSKVWLIYLAGSDGREGFPVSISRQQGQVGGDDWKEILCAFLVFFPTPGIRVVKKKQNKNKRKEWLGKERHGVGGRGGQERDWREKNEKDRGKKWERAGRQTENKKQIGSPRISSPATHCAAKQCNLPRTESQLPQSKAALPALS